MKIKVYENNKLIKEYTNLLMIATKRAIMDTLLGYSDADREIKTLQLGAIGLTNDENRTALDFYLYEVDYNYRVQTGSEVVTRFQFYAEDIGAGVEIKEMGIFGGASGNVMLSRVLCDFTLVAGSEYTIERVDSFEAG